MTVMGLLRWLLARSCGQHTDAGEGALSVWHLQAEIARENRVGRHRLRESAGCASR